LRVRSVSREEVWRVVFKYPPIIYKQETPVKRGKYPGIKQPRGRALPLQRADTPRGLESPNLCHHTAPRCVIADSVDDAVDCPLSIRGSACRYGETLRPTTGRRQPCRYGKCQVQLPDAGSPLRRVAAPHGPQFRFLVLKEDEDKSYTCMQHCANP